MPDTTDISKLPAGGVNAPASGSYGDAAALDRLKEAFGNIPGAGPQAGPGQQSAAPMPTPAPSQIQSPPPAGLPPALLAPTQRPNVPVSTPLAPAGPAMPGPVGPQQQRLAILDALAQNPAVSDTTRQWAELLRERLIQGSAR